MNAARLMGLDVFDSRQLRAALSHFATGVTVITTTDGEGVPVGFTANSFTSVSLDPALVLFCVARSASCHEAFVNGSHFGVHVLSDDQRDLSHRFARSSEDRFDSVDFAQGPGGIPALNDCLTHLHCATERVDDGGDHSIILGRVLAVGGTGEQRPLIFYRGGYRELLEQSAP